MTMAQQYFQCHQGADDQVVAKAREHLTTSYKRLTGFEVQEGGKPSGGFDWFGQPAASESLTYVLSLSSFPCVPKSCPLTVSAWLPTGPTACLSSAT
jgi:hypothetical protein